MKRRPSGTFEWAKYSANCARGCSHNCAYCYSRYNAVVRFKRKTLDTWIEMEIVEKEVRKGWAKKDGTIMFPTTHDITPSILTECIQTMRNILQRGNNILVVSKPHFDCIRQICESLVQYKDNILFRFTIGSMDDRILSLWEPGAPPFQERFESLQLAYNEGFKTSVSCEPLLDSDHVVELFEFLEPYVTDSIWIGKLNKLETRMLDSDPRLAADIQRIAAGQTAERIQEIYDDLKDQPKVRWKESYKNVLGIDSPEDVGMDL